MSGKHQPKNIRNLLQDVATRLKPRKITCAADRDVGRLEAEILLAHVMKKDRVWLLTHGDEHLHATRIARFRSFVARRLKHEPIAYILGEKEFYGLPFLVNPHVLIPRPETEMLVELARDAIRRKPPSAETRRTAPLLWDVGTGSGAIAVAIARSIPSCTVLASDISAESLAMAKKNARRNGVRNITFVKTDLVGDKVRDLLLRRRPPPLIITANLPYLPTGDKKTMDRDVVGYEPASALFAGPDGLAVIEALLRQLSAFDVHFETLLIEHDPRQTKKLNALVKKIFPLANVKARKDLAGRERVTEITQP